MSKLLRKYKTWILAIGGSLLMIAWLFPQAMQQVGGMRFSSTVARYDGGKITGQDYMDAQLELRAISETSPLILEALGLSDGRSLHQDAVDHWVLLSKEAQRQGFVGGPSDGQALIEDVASMVHRRAMMEAQMRGEAPPDLAQVRQIIDANRRAAGGGKPEKWIDTTLAKAAGAARMMQAGRSLGAVISEKESALFAWELFDAAVADVVLVPASSVASELTPPDEARIAAHFERYKNTRPGEGEMGIGYKRDGAVRVEWIAVARQAITDAIPVDPIELNKFWRQNKASFGDNYSEVKAAVEARYRAQQAEKRIEAVRSAIDRQKIKLYGAVELEGRYRKLPADWLTRMPSLEALVEPARAALDLPAAAGMIFATPADSTFRTMNDLRLLPGIGMANGRVGDAPFVSFAQAASQVRELGFKDSLHASQVGVVMGPLRDMMGQNDYYFRVVEARPEGPPSSVHEVLEQVKSDIADLDGFELLRKQQDAYKERLAAKGIADFLAVPGVKTSLDTVVRREYLSANDPSTPFTLREADTKQVREAVMNMVEHWDPQTDVSTLPASERCLVIAEPSARGLVLVSVKARRPLTKEKLDSSQGEVTNYAFQKLMAPSQGSDPYSFESLKQRLHFKPLHERAEDAKPESRPAPAKAG